MRRKARPSIRVTQESQRRLQALVHMHGWHRRQLLKVYGRWLPLARDRQGVLGAAHGALMSTIRRSNERSINLANVARYRESKNIGGFLLINPLFRYRQEYSVSYLMALLQVPRAVHEPSPSRPQAVPSRPAGVRPRALRAGFPQRSGRIPHRAVMTHLRTHC